jgi:hypothetical protein
MWAPDPQSVAPLLAPPVLPATILMCVLVIWTALSALGAVGLDAIDLHADHDLHLPESSGSFGGLTVSWLNLREIPLMLWLGIFGIGWWIVSLVLWAWFDQAQESPSGIITGLLIARNVVITIGLTKAITEPMTGWFKPGEKYAQDTLIGQLCVISTFTATSTSGQAKLKTDAAPLLLNIHTDGETLEKGTLVRIVDYDPQRRIYTVTRATGVEV